MFKTVSADDEMTSLIAGKGMPYPRAMMNDEAQQMHLEGLLTWTRSWAKSCISGWNWARLFGV